MGTSALAIVAPIALLGGALQLPLPYQDRPTYDDLRFEGMKRQLAEPSCATASIATLVKSKFGTELDESELWFGYLAQLSPAMREQALEMGLSVADIARVLGQNGYVAHPVRIGLLELNRSGQPAIVHLERGGVAPLRHFVVFVGLSGTKVTLLDPAIGKRHIEIAEFRRQWEGVAIFVSKP